MALIHLTNIKRRDINGVTASSDLGDEFEHRPLSWMRNLHLDFSLDLLPN